MRYYNLLRNISNWPLYLAVKFGLAHLDPLHFSTRGGVRMEVPRRLLQTFKEIFMDECYLKDMGSRLPENSTIIDVGANAGYFSLFALSRFRYARVFSFEPIPANFRLLGRNRDLNPGLPWLCVQKAVAGQTGELVLAFDGGDDFTTSATVMGNYSGRKDRIRVSAVTIQDILAENGLVRCDLLKMDCEGAEYDILYRCPPEVLGRIERIALEIHEGPGTDQNIEAIEAFLRKGGFITRRRPVGMLAAWRAEEKDGSQDKHPDAT
ncbi:MAG: FkbM family methyltransferase [Smithellaceae bacterium]|nr:FkbM family methyltransferase [Smithellaceae bacterium]